MLTKRIAPCLILVNEKLIHRSRFDDSTDRYIGDPINAVNIFNDYTVDEMFVIDITASKTNRNIKFNLLYDQDRGLQKKINIEQLRRETN